MARLNFRQGIVRRQNDSSNNPIFLQKSGGGVYIDLVVSPEPTIFTIAHYDEDYLITENQTVPHAWGPFSSGVDYWLYWDIDQLTGEITRGFTLVSPVDEPVAPTSPVVDQHWYDMSNKTMKVWNGHSWIEYIRLFACKYQQGSTIIPQPIGSQAGFNNVPTDAGAILFDNEQKPLKKFRRDRRGTFITTESALSSQSSRISNFRMENLINTGKAIENIAIYQPVAWHSYGNLVLARNNVPQFPAIGVSSEDMYIGEVRTYITKGYIQHDLWEFSNPVGTPLFVSSDGQLTTAVPNSISMQYMGYIVDKNTIFIDPGNIILLNGIGNLSALHVDKNSGKLVTKDVVGTTNVVGISYEVDTASDEWVIEHEIDTRQMVVQVFDENDLWLLPDEVEIIDNDTVKITFATPQIGKAHIILFR